MSESSPRAPASSRVGASITESLRLAPSMATPKGMPCKSVRIDHFHPSLLRSVGFLPVPSPPQGLLCREPSTDTSERLRPMILSEPCNASRAKASNTPAAIHSSRRVRIVVSDTLCPHSRSASSQEQPVTRRTNIPSKQSRSVALGRWQPNGWVRSGGGISGAMAAQTVSPTSGSSARMMVGTSTWSLVGWVSTPSFMGPPPRPVDGRLLQRAYSQVRALSPIRAASKKLSDDLFVRAVGSETQAPLHCFVEVAEVSTARVALATLITDVLADALQSSAGGTDRCCRLVTHLFECLFPDVRTRTQLRSATRSGDAGAIPLLRYAFSRSSRGSSLVSSSTSARRALRWFLSSSDSMPIWKIFQRDGLSAIGYVPRASV